LDSTIALVNFYSLFGDNINTQNMTGSQLDFQVQPQIGNVSLVPTGLMAGNECSFTGESSDWSNTQTITTPETTVYSVNPTPTIIPELSWLVILPLFGLVLSVLALKLRHRKTPIKP